MSLFYYMDNEGADYTAQWDSRTQAGSSDISYSSLAARPGRGTKGLRCEIAGTDEAYVSKTINHSIGAGEWIYTGFWMKNRGSSILTCYPVYIADVMAMRIETDRSLRIYAYNDAASANASSVTSVLAYLRWYYIVICVKRAATAISADGQACIFVNGTNATSVTGVDNYHRATTAVDFSLGAVLTAFNAFRADFDEVVISETYPGHSVKGLSSLEIAHNGSIGNLGVRRFASVI